jgi:hypothetical protein
MSNNPEENKVTTEAEIGSNGVEHSKVSGSKEAIKPAGSTPAGASDELRLLLEASAKTIENLEHQLAEAKAQQAASNNKDDSAINRLADLLSNMIPVKGQTAEPDNVNKAVDYSKRQLVDGRSLMEAQETLQMYKDEPKVPVSIPKSFVAAFGPSLPVSVNGIRVSIPCDGKIYQINATHAEAARERIAKVDRLLADDSDSVIETMA